MNGSDAHLVQSCEEVLGHIYRLFKAVQPVIGGPHSSSSEKEQRGRVRVRKSLRKLQ